jgi:hypothetical protein
MVVKYFIATQKMEAARSFVNKYGIVLFVFGFTSNDKEVESRKIYGLLHNAS